MKIFNNILNRILSYTRQVGLMSPLSFDQQVWGAKSVIDLVQHGSKFLLANGVNGGDCYTCWLGARDNRPTAIVISSTGHATGPFPDDSRVKDCQPWTYPPAINCSQAVEVLIKTGITEVWADCTLKQTAGQKNPAYTFTFAQHPPVTIDAVTGKII
jgi:hypothetical protein